MRAEKNDDFSIQSGLTPSSQNFRNSQTEALILDPDPETQLIQKFKEVKIRPLSRRQFSMVFGPPVECMLYSVNAEQ